MKAFLVVCILLASVLILPSSITARELIPKEENSGLKHEDIISNESVTDASGGGRAVTPGTGGRNKPANGNCGRGKPYAPCLNPKNPKHPPVASQEIP